MDLEDLERKMTPKTKAIMGVHWGGYPLDLERLEISEVDLEVNMDGNQH